MTYDAERLLFNADRIDGSTAVGHTIRNHIDKGYGGQVAATYVRELKILSIERAEPQPPDEKNRTKIWFGAPAMDAYEQIKRDSGATPEKAEVSDRTAELFARIVIEGIWIQFAESGIFLDKK